MSKLMPSDISDDVRKVLVGAAKGDGDHPNFLTAYQILDRLPAGVKDRLIRERGLGGKGTGTHYAAPSVVSDAAEKIAGIKIDYIDNRGIQLAIDGTKITPGFEVCGIYRLDPKFA